MAIPAPVDTTPFERTASKDAASGYAGLDGDGALNVAEISGTVQSTHALLEAVVPANAGSIGAVSHCDFLYHAARWHPSTLASLGAMVLTPMGSAAYNGGLLNERYTAIQSLSPMATTLAADNRSHLFLVGGDWTLGASLTLANHTVLWLLNGARIIAGSFKIAHTSKNASIISDGSGRLASGNTSHVMTMRGTNTGFTHKNFTIEGTGHNAILIDFDGTTFASAIIENVRTNLTRLYGCLDGEDITSPPVLDSASEFRGCKGGNQSFFGVNLGFVAGMDVYAGQISGQLIDCEMTGTICDINFTATGKMLNSRWSAPVRGLTTGAQFRFSNIGQGGTTWSLSNDAAVDGATTVAADILVANCALTAEAAGSGATHKGLGASITNKITTANEHGNSFYGT